MNVEVSILGPDGKMPTKAYKTDAGFDLYSSQDKRIGGLDSDDTGGYSDQVVVATQIAIRIPEGFVGLIWPRSGLAVSHGLDTLAGVIDHGYLGEIKVVLNVNGEDPLYVKKGDRIAQLIIQPIPEVTLIEKDFPSLSTDRGVKGIGSSGK